MAHSTFHESVLCVGVKCANLRCVSFVLLEPDQVLSKESGNGFGSCPLTVDDSARDTKKRGPLCKGNVPSRLPAWSSGRLVCEESFRDILSNVDEKNTELSFTTIVRTTFLFYRSFISNRKGFYLQTFSETPI